MLTTIALILSCFYIDELLEKTSAHNTIVKNNESILNLALHTSAWIATTQHKNSMLHNKEIKDLTVTCLMLAAHQYKNFYKNKKNNKLLKDLKNLGKKIQIIENAYNYYLQVWFFTRNLVYDYNKHVKSNINQPFDYNKYIVERSDLLKMMNATFATTACKYFSDYRAPDEKARQVQSQIISFIKNNQQNLNHLNELLNEYLKSLSILGFLHISIGEKVLQKIIDICEKFES